MNPSPPAKHSELRCDYSVQGSGEILFSVFGVNGAGSFTFHGPLALAGELCGAINNRGAMREALRDAVWAIEKAHLARHHVLTAHESRPGVPLDVMDYIHDHFSFENTLAKARTALALAEGRDV